MFKKTRLWSFSDECKTFFKKLKKTFFSVLIIAYFDSRKKTVLKADASNWAAEKVLSQYVENEIFWLITYFFVKYNFQKCNYEIYDKKLLIIIKILKKWHSELQDVKKKFKIIINYKNFQHFMIMKLLNQKQIRWSKFFSIFNFRIVYCSDKLTDKSDAFF